MGFNFLGLGETLPATAAPDVFLKCTIPKQRATTLYQVCCYASTWLFCSCFCWARDSSLSFSKRSCLAISSIRWWFCTVSTYSKQINSACCCQRAEKYIKEIICLTSPLSTSLPYTLLLRNDSKGLDWRFLKALDQRLGRFPVGQLVTWFLPRHTVCLS